MCDLLDIEDGITCRILTMKYVDVTLRKKLMNLGFLPKTDIKIQYRSPFGDPIAVTCNNTTIALRKSIISNIKVERIPL